jgi:xylulose-5-phosphate/fructose-6-phosphate phosphoketolase
MKKKTSESAHTGWPLSAEVLQNRFHLVNDVIDRVPTLDFEAACARQFIRDRLFDHKTYIHRYGQDMPEIRNWKWAEGGSV